MIHECYGDIFRSGCKILVNPVNCVGIMGAGLALQFRNRYPNMYKQYIKDCNMGTVVLGGINVHDIGNGKKIINLPTKRDWKHKSRLDEIELGLESLKSYVLDSGLHSVAIPALGCGLGELNYKDVKPLIEKKFEDVPYGLSVLLYQPLVDGETKRARKKKNEYQKV